MVKSRRVEHAEDTRTALLTSAQELFAEKGYAATHLVEIARHARVTTGALYHHFADKKDLLHAVIATSQQDRIDALVEQFTRLTERGELEDADLWDLIRLGAHAFLNDVDTRLVQLWRVEAPAVLGLQEARRLAEQSYLGVYRVWLERAMDEGLIDPLPVDPLTALLGALMGEAITYLAGAEDFDAARQEVGQVIDRILEGLRAT
jgi:AcrR family transcriptional regulator